MIFSIQLFIVNILKTVVVNSDGKTVKGVRCSAIHRRLFAVFFVGVAVSNRAASPLKVGL